MFTYTKYAVPGWPPCGDPPETLYMPDQILDVFHASYKATGRVGRKNVFFLPDIPLRWEESQEIARETLARLDHAWASALDDVKSSGRFDVRFSDKGWTNGHAGGGIHMEYTEKFSDAPTLAHEMGHFLAESNGGLSMNLMELQGMFCECAALDMLRQRGLSTAVDAYEAFWREQFLFLRPWRMKELAASRSGKATEESKQNAYFLHRHAPSQILANGFYERSKAMTPSQRRAFMETLYRGGVSPRLETVLAAAGVRNEAELYDFLSFALTKSGLPAIQVSTPAVKTSLPLKWDV